MYKMKNGDVFEGPFKDYAMNGIGIVHHSDGQTSRAEYRDNKKVRDIDQDEETKQGRPEEENKESVEECKQLKQHDPTEEQANKEVQLLRVHDRYDIVETEIKLLYNDDYIHLMVRPYKNDSTKVIMWVAG